MKKAIFLDRDGVIIKERGKYNYKVAHTKFVNGIVETLETLKNNGYIFIIITNQGGIAKGIYTHQDVKEIHKLIKDFFSSFHIAIKDIIYCPHHDSVSKCLCRKPDSLMLEKAIAKHDIDITESYFIGDSQRDVEAGRKAGLQTIKIEPNDNLLNYLNEIIK